MKILLIFVFAISSSSAIILNCSYFYNDYILIGKEYTCCATISNETGNNVLIDVTGIHQDGKDNSDVLAIEMQNATKLSFIPQGIETFFPNLLALIIENHNIIELDGDELRNYNDLKLFGLLYGKLEKISGDLLDPTPHMTHLWFTQNKIKNVSENFLNNLENLMFADFTGNDCVSQQALSSYEMLDLIENIRLNCTDAFVITPEASTSVMESLVEDSDVKICEKGSETERICKLEQENEELQKKFNEMAEKLNILQNLILKKEKNEIKP